MSVHHGMLCAAIFRDGEHWGVQVGTVEGDSTPRTVLTGETYTVASMLAESLNTGGGEPGEVEELADVIRAELAE
jgi:hypothetical protein